MYIYGSNYGKVETEFSEAQKHKLLVWFCYIDDGFFISTHGKEKLSSFLEALESSAFTSNFLMKKIRRFFKH